MGKFLLIGFLLIFAQAASAHSPLTSVIPEDGAILEKPPQKIEMSFKASVKLIKLELHKLTSDVPNSSGGSFFSNGDTVKISLDESFLMKTLDRHLINLPFLDYGMYKVKWRALGGDGHVMKGSFSFNILGY